MNKENVIKGLECHRIDNNHRINCTDCPYYVDDDNHIQCVNNLHDDAISMLKEQEAKPMIENERGWNCPSCGMKLIGKTASGYPCNLIDLPLNFCQMCGQGVKWDE